MKINPTKFLVIILLLGLQASVIHAVPYDIVIEGKGEPKLDVLAVQKAVDQGGTILLKGMFNFGEKGRVNITKDIVIYGEANEKGIPTTQIVGGSWSFHSPIPTQLPPPGPGPKITIRNIHFSGALWAPISLSYCNGVEIRNNIITNVLPYDNKKPYFGKDGIHRQQGIIFYPPYTLPKEHGTYLPGLITGIIVVAGNAIDLNNTIPTLTVAQGILVVGTTGANIQILKNRVSNSCRNSIEVIDNYPGPSGEGSTIIQGNTIITAKKGIPLPSPSTPNGIVAGWFLDQSGAADPARRNRIIAAGNAIETRGETSIGIIVISDGAVITSNQIHLNGKENAKGILHFNSYGTISYNKFKGRGLAGVILRPWKAFSGNENTLINNDFSLLEPTKANILIRSSDNVVIGKYSKILNHGKTNLILN